MPSVLKSTDCLRDYLQVDIRIQTPAAVKAVICSLYSNRVCHSESKVVPWNYAKVKTIGYRKKRGEKLLLNIKETE